MSDWILRIVAVFGLLALGDAWMPVAEALVIAAAALAVTALVVQSYTRQPRSS